MTRWGKGHDEQAGDGVDHGDPLVELTRVSFIAEAVAICQNLERAGIPATVFESDAGGWAPHYGVAQGQRVMVHAGSLERARELLSDLGGQLPVDDPPLTAEVRKHLRPHQPSPPG